MSRGFLLALGAIAAVAGALVFGAITMRPPPVVAEIRSPEPSSPPADKEALQLARNIRILYPLLREIQQAADEFGECMKKSKPANCAQAYSTACGRVVDEFKRQPAPDGPCASEMQQVVADQIARALVESTGRPVREPSGVAWQSVHGSYRVCCDKLFRYKIGQRLMGAPTAAGAATYLGVRDDPTTAGPIHPGLFSSNGAPIDDQSLAAN